IILRTDFIPRYRSSTVYRPLNGNEGGSHSSPLSGIAILAGDILNIPNADPLGAPTPRSGSPPLIIDPLLLGTPVKENHPPPPSAAVPKVPVKTSSGSSLSDMAQKAQASAKKLPQKAESFEDKVLKISSDGMKLSHEREQAHLALDSQKLCLKERCQILEEKKAGLLTTPQARKRLVSLDDGHNGISSTPTCNRKRQHQQRQASEDWDCENSSRLPSSDGEFESEA
ncbi:hypothetical protein FB446DRAFT_786966, partial [Lentinula raphanica]